MKNIFVFGTLMFPEVLKALLGKVPEMTEAILKGYKRSQIHLPGRVAKGPGLSLSGDHSVSGVILRNLTQRDVEILDLFEDAASGLMRISSIVTDKTGKELTADFYVVTEELEPYLANEEWSEEGFRTNYLNIYVSERIPELLSKWKSSGVLPS